MPAHARAPSQPPFTWHSEKASQPGQWVCLLVSTLETYGYLLRNARATFSLIMDRQQASRVFFSLALEQPNAEVRMVSRRTVLLRRQIHRRSPFFHRLLQQRSEAWIALVANLVILVNWPSPGRQLWSYPR